MNVAGGRDPDGEPLDPAGTVQPLEWLMLAGAILAPFNLVLGIEIAGLNLRPLHVWALAALLVLLAADRDELVQRANAGVLAFWWLVAFILLSTGLATPPEYRERGFADVVLLAANIAAFTVVRCYYGARPRAWHRFFTALALSAVAVCLVFLWRAINALAAGVPVQEDSYALGLGTVVGSYTSALAAGAAAFVVFAATRRAVVLGVAAFAVFATAAILALARGPWLAFAVGMVAAVLLVVWRYGLYKAGVRIGIRTVAMLLAGPLNFAAILYLSPFARQLLTQRVVLLLDPQEGTVFGRFVLWEALLRDARLSPLFGHGASAYRAVSELLGTHGSVSENFLIEMLHATGLTGVLLLATGFLVAAFHAARPSTTKDRPARAAASIAAATTVILAAMTNPAAWNGLFWILLGVAASYPVQRVTGELAASEPATSELATGDLATNS